MVSKLVAVALIVVFVLFLLSVFGPMHSQKKFWIMIQRIRGKMDLAVYWFFNLCAVLAVSYIVIMAVRGLSA